MTMFRRVFSNHLDGQGPDADPPKHVAVDSDVPPAAPSMPPQLKPHEKSPLTEMRQTPPAGDAMLPVVEEVSVEDDGLGEVDADVTARAAEIHAQMIQRDVTTAPRAALDAALPAEPASKAAKPAHRSGRARTRLLGFNTGGEVASDPIVSAQAAPPTALQINPAGWLAIVKGPGTGHHFAVFGGVAMVGRGEDQGIRLDFGDQAVSRQNHAAFAYDAEDNKFYLGHGGKSNIIKLNGRPVLSTEEVFHGDMIRIGETTLRFVALCGADFQWGGEADA